MKTIICLRCHVKKEEADFPLKKKGFGRIQTCTECENYKKAWRELNRETDREYGRKFRKKKEMLKLQDYVKTTGKILGMMSPDDPNRELFSAVLRATKDIVAIFKNQNI